MAKSVASSMKGAHGLSAWHHQHVAKWHLKWLWRIGGGYQAYQ